MLDPEDTLDQLLELAFAGGNSLINKLSSTTLSLPRLLLIFPLLALLSDWTVRSSRECEDISLDPEDNRDQLLELVFTVKGGNSVDGLSLYSPFLVFLFLAAVASSSPEISRSRLELILAFIDGNSVDAVFSVGIADWTRPSM